MSSARSGQMSKKLIDPRFSICNIALFIFTSVLFRLLQSELERYWHAGFTPCCVGFVRVKRRGAFIYWMYQISWMVQNRIKVCITHDCQVLNVYINTNF